jgi:2-polyprenyl-3-methyl-5-hydroxy-6-metoxy-1,4-benzoquinol methylase
MNSIVKQSYWDKGYERMKLSYSTDALLFKDLFDRFLPKGGSCFEIGCYPGNYLYYMGKKFGYIVSGIDLTPHTEQLAKHFLEGGLKTGYFYQQDFMQFSTPDTYDMVCSFGFIEHFINFDQIRAMHIDLVKPGGTLVLSYPNFRYLQYIFHWLFDNLNLQRHVTGSMNLAKWKRVLTSRNMEILYKGYYHTAGFWIDNPRTGKTQKKWLA